MGFWSALGKVAKIAVPIALYMTGVGAPAAMAIQAGTNLAVDKASGKSWKASLGSAALGAASAGVGGAGSALAAKTGSLAAKTAIGAGTGAAQGALTGGKKGALTGAMTGAATTALKGSGGTKEVARRAVPGTTPAPSSIASTLPGNNPMSKLSLPAGLPSGVNLNTPKTGGGVDWSSIMKTAASGAASGGGGTGGGGSKLPVGDLIKLYLAQAGINAVGGMIAGEDPQDEPLKGYRGPLTTPENSLSHALMAIQRLGQGMSGDFNKPINLGQATVQDIRPVTVPGLPFQIGGGFGTDPALKDPSILQYKSNAMAYDPFQSNPAALGGGQPGQAKPRPVQRKAPK
jgi:hypothetical protein